ncbi:MAG: flagellar biosynthesis anti-sigma factor FlgM [Burkholderiales bacterium]|nr:flagellar biosynthesis anti-sigma factor FlgM [Burkholderiales bacterium]MBH2017678.1 flagellar biosynthesis anti-sigma factor FlgM [Burkholderiales bacterium]
MKIGNPIDKALGGVSPRTEGAASTNASGKASSTDEAISQSAKVTLSTSATGLMAGGDGVMDMAKVSRVKQAIDDGSYKANPEVIADKLISNARELLQRKQA